MTKMKSNCNLIWADPVMQNSPAAKQQPDLQLYFGINNSFFFQLDHCVSSHVIPAITTHNISDLNNYMQ